jgi:light-regulated signal transduction histidine kinase (bacteriophytochrome)
MLVYNNEETKNETIDTLHRINKSAHKMHVLITDLADLTNLTKTDENKSPTNINRIVQHTLIDLGDRVKEKNALIKVSQLPTIDGYELQLKMLFKALIDNALKFSKTNELPCITISYKKVNEPIVSHNNADPNTNYHRISISDTGIGFENKYIDNIFKIFGRLHTDQSGYDGKGVGLAKCNRIMTNHNGYIAAEGVVNGGATFHLYFPA